MAVVRGVKSSVGLIARVARAPRSTRACQEAAVMASEVVARGAMTATRRTETVAPALAQLRTDTAVLTSLCRRSHVGRWSTGAHQCAETVLELDIKSVCPTAMTVTKFHRMDARLRVW
jgi:hypothetical protein